MGDRAPRSTSALEALKASRTISLEQREGLPESSWDLPRDELYMQLGCKSCVNQVCFTAKGVTSKVPEYSRAPRATADLRDITDLVEKQTSVHQAMTSTWNDDCVDGCADSEAIEIAVELLNERFSASLTQGDRE